LVLFKLNTTAKIAKIATEPAPTLPTTAVETEAIPPVKT